MYWVNLSPCRFLPYFGQLEVKRGHRILVTVFTCGFYASHVQKEKREREKEKERERERVEWRGKSGSRKQVIFLL